MNRLGVTETQAVCMKVVTNSSVASPKFRGVVLTLSEEWYLFGALPVKAQNDKIC